jgi:uncharacterized membrane protein
MNKFVIALFLIPLIDAPWLYLTSPYVIPIYEKIQGGPLKVAPLAAVAVYVALAWLLIQQTSVTGAFLNGAAIYAVYDFTNLTIFKNYSLAMAVADTVWGGCLFAISHYVLSLF